MPSIVMLDGCRAGVMLQTPQVYTLRAEMLPRRGDNGLGHVQLCRCIQQARTAFIAEV